MENREQNSGTSAEPGRKVDRSENLSEGGEMHDKKDKNLKRMENESTRRPGSEGYGSSSSDRKGSMDEQNISGSEPRKDRDRSGSLGSNRNSSDNSEGRH